MKLIILKDVVTEEYSKLVKDINGNTVRIYETKIIIPAGTIIEVEEVEK